MTERTLRDIQPSMPELARVVACAWPRQYWPHRVELLGLAASMVQLRIRIWAFLALDGRGWF